jgi:hypothetical protein
MTTKHVVADDVLGRISRKVWELTRRVLEGSADPERVLAILQPAFEGVPKPNNEGCSHGTYLLESHWAWDSFHYEFATIGLEKGESDIPFEGLLDPLVPEEKKARLLKMLRRIYDAQISIPLSSKMRRLYRVLGARYFGYEPGCGLDGTLKREAVDVHLILQPLFDFNDKGEPIPCKVEKT